MTARYPLLAVEDDADTLALLRIVLQALPLDIVHAPTGADAIRYLERQVPALILLDLVLPDMRGWDVLDRFKDDERLREVRVVVLTAAGDPVHRLIGMLQPIAAYLRKPVPPEVLRDQVRALLNLA